MWDIEQLVLQITDLDIEGFLRELTDWKESLPPSDEVRHAMLDSVLDIFFYYCNGDITSF